LFEQKKKRTKGEVKMKKMLVLTLVLGIASLATAGLTDTYVSGDVTWTLDLGAGTMTGVSSSATAYQEYLMVSVGTVNGTTVYDAAGDAGAITTPYDYMAGYEQYYLINAEQVAPEGSLFAAGTWFVFDVSGNDEVTVLDGSGVQVMNATPEPATMALLGLGALVLRRRK
jgi:hypothetical protein